MELDFLFSANIELAKERVGPIQHIDFWIFLIVNKSREKKTNKV